MRGAPAPGGLPCQVGTQRRSSRAGYRRCQLPPQQMYGTLIDAVLHVDLTLESGKVVGSNGYSRDTLPCPMSE